MHSIECRWGRGCWLVLLLVLVGCNGVRQLLGERKAVSTASAVAALPAPVPSAVAATLRSEISPPTEPIVVPEDEERQQVPEKSRRAIPLPLMVMPLGAASVGPTVQAKSLLPPDEFDDGLLRPPIGPLPQAVDHELRPGAVRPPAAQIYAQNIADRPVPRLGSEPWMISEDWETRHNAQLSAPNREKSKLVFLGDSITDGWRSSSSYRKLFAAYSPLNLGIAGDFTQNLLWRIEHGALDGLSPKVVVVMIGVNNLGGGFTAEQTASGVRAVLAAARGKLPQSPIVVLSILPAGENPDAPLRQKIVETNELIAKLRIAGVTVVDIGAVLLEPDGTISKSLLRDFLHPTEAGYTRLGDALAPRLQEIMEQG